MLGFDAVYFFSESVSVGLFLAAGLNFKNQLKHSFLLHDPTSSDSSETDNKFHAEHFGEVEYKSKETLFVKVKLPILFYVKKFRFGLIGSYEYRKIKSNHEGAKFNGKPVNLDYLNNMFTVAFVLGLPF